MIDAYEQGENEYNKPFLLIDNTNSSNNKKEFEEMKYKGNKITKRNDGRYCYRYTINGKRKTIYGNTQQECLNKTKKT